MNMTKFYIGLFSLVVLLTGCSLNSDTVIVPDVEDEFYIELSEVFNGGERSLNWKLRTIESVGCKGAGISFSFKREAGPLFSLSINNVVRPSDCDPAEEPARAVVEVGALQQGSYPVSVSLRETLNQDGILSVYKAFYQFTIDGGSGVLPLRERLYRIPDNTVWGYVDTKGVDSLMSPAEAFLTDIQEHTQEQALVNGHYGYFEWDNGSGQLTFPDAPPTSTGFQYSIREDRKEALVNLISAYREDYEGLDIVIFNTLGEEW